MVLIKLSVHMMNIIFGIFVHITISYGIGQNYTAGHVIIAMSPCTLNAHFGYG